MLAVNVTVLEDPTGAFVLVGPEGVVWTQPAIGEAYIIGARNEEERRYADAFVGELLRMGLVPWGLPLN